MWKLPLLTLQALVHFIVGIGLGIILLSLVDLPPKQEFLLMFYSGFWAMLPDGHWLFREFEYMGIAAIWRSFHQTPYANIFWFHHFIDSIETGRKNLESGIALILLFIIISGYYQYNDWTID
jgi:hypothetical protein